MSASCITSACGAREWIRTTRNTVFKTAMSAGCITRACAGLSRASGFYAIRERNLFYEIDRITNTREAYCLT